jgi:hypothetical protein
VKNNKGISKNVYFEDSDDELPENFKPEFNQEEEKMEIEEDDKIDNDPIGRSEIKTKSKKILNIDKKIVRREEVEKLKSKKDYAKLV